MTTVVLRMTRLMVAAVVLIGAVVRVSGATVGTVAPVELRVWLRGVAFIGVGHIAKLKLNPKTGSWTITISEVQAWKGKPPDSVEFYSLPPIWGLSEGQKVVFLAYKPRPKGSPYLAYCCPMPVFRMGARDCFQLQASHLLISNELLAVHWERGPKIDGAPTFVLLDAFRDAVQQADLVDAP